MYMIVGLGNPGDKYAATKHNVGFWVVDRLASAMNVTTFKKQCQSLTAISFWKGKKILLVKPQTFMNLSGQAVIELLNYYNEQIDDFLVIHDDLDLPPGQLRFKQSGSSGGHNGIKNIAQHLNSNEFDRLKLGIGRSNNTVDYVLSPFSQKEKIILDEAVDLAVEAIGFWLEKGIKDAMNHYNQKKKTPKDPLDHV